MNPAIALVAVVGCIPVAVTTSSRTFLGADQSRAVIGEDVPAAALDVTRMFGERRFNLVDQRRERGNLVLVFRGERTTVTSGNRYSVSSVDVGSEFVATLRALPGGATQVEIEGRPLYDGGQPYVSPLVDLNGARVSGAEEADVVHGVIAELALASKVVPTPRTAVVPTPSRLAGQPSPVDACMEERHGVYTRAARTGDPATRAKVYESAPDCVSVAP
jgi:hypothetical protein